MKDIPKNWKIELSYFDNLMENINKEKRISRKIH